MQLAGWTQPTLSPADAPLCGANLEMLTKHTEGQPAKVAETASEQSKVVLACHKNKMFRMACNLQDELNQLFAQQIQLNLVYIWKYLLSIQ